MADVLIVGADLSSRRVAFVAHHPLTNTTICRAYDLYGKSGKQTPESLGRAIDATQDFLTDVLPLKSPYRYSWVEDPLIGRGGTTATIKQAYVGGIVRALLHQAGFTVYGVNVSSWKKGVVGNGRAQKPVIAKAVRQKWPKVHHLLGGDGDLTDAAAIVLYGKDVLAKTDAAGFAAGHAELRLQEV